jgi:predicted DNA repair protein MutK
VIIKRINPAALVTIIAVLSLVALIILATYYSHPGVGAHVYDAGLRIANNALVEGARIGGRLG